MARRIYFLIFLFFESCFSNAYAEAGSLFCAERFKEFFKPFVQIPTWLPNSYRDAHSNYQSTYQQLINLELLPLSSSSGGQLAVTNIVKRELSKMDFPTMNFSFEDGLRITPDMLKTRHIGLSQKALLHPLMPAYLRELERLGGSLYVNPARLTKSLPEVVSGGAYLPVESKISIMPHTAWDQFLHEYQHFIYDRMGLIWKDLDDDLFKEAALNRPSFNLGLKPKAIEKEFAALSELGFSNQTINESIAVTAEIKGLRDMGYSSWNLPIYKAQLYKWSFQEKELMEAVRTGSATPEQKQALMLIRARKLLLHPKFLQSLLAAGAGALYFYREETDELLVRTQSGVLQAFEIARFVSE
ncbi:MAG: hypothetical protein NDJ89_06840 [Oligoflexia bacterium]|nr:hypothetical protein [Oligoflexia bacterium]